MPVAVTRRISLEPLRVRAIVDDVASVCKTDDAVGMRAAVVFDSLIDSRRSAGVRVSTSRRT